MTSPALFVAAHPDDETLAMGVAIAEHVAAGQDVHVLLMTDGDGSDVIDILNGGATSGWWGLTHSPAAEGYAPLTPATIAAARVEEAQTALRCLSAGLPGTLTLHRAQMPDGYAGTTAASLAAAVPAARAAIEAVCDVIAPGGAVRLKGHSPIVDNHRDHLAVGQALTSMRSADPARYGDQRYYVEPPYWSDTRLSQVTESWDTPTNADIRARAVNACRAYGAWAPGAGRYAIGWHSVYSSFFAPLLANVRCMVHA